MPLHFTQGYNTQDRMAAEFSYGHEVQYIFMRSIIYYLLSDKPLNNELLVYFNFQTRQPFAPLPGALQEAEPAVAAALHPGRNCTQPRGGQRYVCL